MANRNSNKNNTKSNNLTVLPKGGVSLEVGRGYRGSITVDGRRYRTRHYATKRAALKELNTIRGELMEVL